MKKSSTKIWLLMVLTFMLGAMAPATAQTLTAKVLGTNLGVSAACKDAAGNVYVVETVAPAQNQTQQDAQIVKFAAGTSTPTILTGTTFQYSEYESVLNFAFGIGVDGSGNIFVTTYNDYFPSDGRDVTTYGNILKFTPTGGNAYTKSTWVTGEYPSGSTIGAFGALVIDSHDNIFVDAYSDLDGKYEIIEYPSGSTTATAIYTHIGDAQLASSDNYSPFTALAIDPSDNLYAGTSFSTSGGADGGKLYKLTKASNYATVTQFGTNLYCTALACDASGALYGSIGVQSASAPYTVTSPKIVKFSSDLSTTTPLYTGVSFGLYAPWGLAVPNATSIFAGAGGGAGSDLGDLVQLFGTPATPASNVAFSSITATTATVSWTNGSGSSRAVFIKNANTSQPVPVNATTYTANTTFTSGTQIGATGWYCIYNGTGNTVNVTGLTQGQNYQVMVVEYNGAAGSENYLQTSGTNNPNTFIAAGAAPTITSVTSSTTDGAYKATSVIPVTVTFSAAVTVTGTPQLTLETGTTDRVVNYASGSGTTTLTFNYTVQAGDTSPDLDYTGTTALALNSGTINATSGGTAATLTLPAPGTAGSLGANKNLVIDTQAPTVSSIPIADPTPSGSAVLHFTVNFSEDVTGVDISDFNFSTNNSVTATLVSIVPVNAHSYTATANVAGTGNLRLNLSNSTGSNTGIADLAGNAITTTASGYTGGGVYTLDHTAPTLTARSITSNNGTTTLAVTGNIVTLTFTSSETINTPVVTIATHTVTTTHTGNNWTATYTLTGTDTEGVIPFSIDFTDVNGNAGTTVTTTTNSTSVTFDRTAPALTITSNVSTLKAGESATITFTFSEDPASSFTWDGTTGDVVVSGGVMGAISGSGTTRTATFTPTAGTNNGTASITVAAASYTDAAGNPGSAGASPALSFDTGLPNPPSTPDLASASDDGTSNTDNITTITTPVFTGTAELGATVTLYDTNGTTVLGTVVATDGTWSITSSALSKTAHTITAKATDAAGNVSSASSGLSITVNPPITVSPATLPNATSTLVYNRTLTATGGTAPYTFAVTSGALPAGVTLTGNTLSGIPTQLGSFTFTITATDAASATGSQTYTITVNPPTLTISPLTIVATVGTFSSQTLTTSASPIVNTPTYTYVVTAGALPPGMTLSSGGFFGGTPTADGTFNFTITSTDNNTGAGPYSTSQAFTLTVSPPTILIQPLPLPGASSVVAYNQTLTSFNGTAPYTYTITAGALPPGLTLSSGGTITGTATALGTFTFTITSTDSSTGTGPFTKAQPFSITVAGPIPTVVAATLPPLKVGVPYSFTFTATGTNTTAPYTFAQTGGGAIPPGLTLAADGTLSGIPTKAGNYIMQIRPTDSSPGPGPYPGAARVFSGMISAPTIVVGPASVPDGTAGVAYSENIVATGGTAPYTYAVTAGALPAGVTLATDGTLSGTSNVTGTYNFTVTATDATTGTGAPYTASTSYTLNFVAPAITLAPATIPSATVGTAYSQSVTASNGTAPYTYAVTSGALPAGLSLSASTGAITGTPTAGGSFNFTVTATDGNSFTGSQAYTLTTNAPTITVAPTTLSLLQVGVAYSQAITASGGTATYTYAITSGALPAGLALATDGTLSGTATAGGTFNFTITATDGSTGTGPYTGSRAYTLTLSSPPLSIAPATLTAATVGAAYTQAITASGATAPYTYQLKTGALPPGMTVASDGTLSGTPTAGGTFHFTISATDNSTGTGPFTGGRPYNFTVNAPTIVVAPATLPAAIVGFAYNQTIAASGGTSTYTYAVTAGALPAGLTLASDGTLSGTPTAGGTFNFTITATDSSTGTGPYTGSQAYTFTVTAPLIAILPSSFSAATVGTAYSATASGAGGTAPYTFAITSGTLPAGLTLASDGTLSGTPTAAGNFTFRITATDNSTGTGPYSTSRTYLHFTVNAPTITLAPLTLVDGTAGVTYSQLITASGGIPAYNYVLTAGALPAGLTLASDGTLSGTPTAGGTFNFTITATDSSTGTGPFNGSAAYTLSVNAPTLTLTPATLPAATVGTAYSQAITASGGTTPYAYAVTAGALPVGIVLSSTGTLSGTPTAGGTFNFTVTATDASTGSGPYTASAAYSITTGKVDQTIAFADVTATYGDAPVTLTGTASSGLGVTYASSNTSVATINGNTLTILAAGTATITASQGGDANNNAATSVAKTLTVNARALTITATGNSKTYGAADPALTYQVTSGSLVGTDVFTGALTRDAGETVNTYAIKQGTLALNSNYILTYAGANFTITQASLTVKANDQTRAYNAGNPTFTVSYTGFVNGDTEAGLTAKPTVSTTATASSPVGTYPITVAGAASPNYMISYSPGTLTITQAVLTVTADNKSRKYGDANPAFTLTYSGFINGDDASKLTTAPVAVNNSTATTAPGNYPITISGGASADYTFNYVPGTLTITPLTDASLISLTTSAGSLSPAFDDGTFTYNVQVENTVTDLSLTSTFTVTASATVNGTAVPNGSPSSRVPLNVGDNVITLIVTAQDGVTKKSYTINVYRGISPTSITSNNILTPNGDGKNDFWVVKDIQLYPNNSVRVYDSAGRLVYGKRGYSNDWGGTLNDTGSPLTQGTYYYLVDLGTGENAIRGYINIIRSR